MAVPIAVNRIEVDDGMSPRQGIDLETVDQYALSFTDLPPIVVFEVEPDSYLLADGFHRIRAAKKLELTEVLADVRQGDRNAAWEHAVLANLKHGRPLSRRERRNVVEALLKLHTERTNRWIAADAGVSHHTVAAIRQDLVTSGQIARLRTLYDEDGMEYPYTYSDEKAEPPKEEEVPIAVRPGDVWILGAHLLCCMDSGSQDFIAKVATQRAAFAFADPPYNVEAAEWDSGFEWRHDYLSEVSSVVAVTPGIVNLQAFLTNTQMPYKWAMSFWIDNGMTRGALGFGNWICVPIFSNDTVYRNAQDFKRISITSSDRDDAEHKGRKPLEVLRTLVGLFSNEGEVVIDPFLGTGTTLIACEQLGRRCIGAELDPTYCENIIERWQKLTGRKAE